MANTNANTAPLSSATPMSTATVVERYNSLQGKWDLAFGMTVGQLEEMKAKVAHEPLLVEMFEKEYRVTSLGEVPTWCVDDYRIDYLYGDLPKFRRVWDALGYDIPKQWVIRLREAGMTNGDYLEAVTTLLLNPKGKFQCSLAAQLRTWLDAPTKPYLKPLSIKQFECMGIKPVVWNLSR